VVCFANGEDLGFTSPFDRAVTGMVSDGSNRMDAV